MSNYNYQTNCGQYLLHDGDQPIGPVMDEVAIAYSIDSVDKLFTLHKHGSPEMVKAWLEKTQSRLRLAGDEFGRKLADEFRMIQGRLDLDAVNAALDGAHAGILRVIGNAGAIEASTRVIKDAPEASMVELIQMENNIPSRRIAP